MYTSAYDSPFAGGEDNGYFLIRRLRVRIRSRRKPCSSAWIEQRNLNTVVEFSPVIFSRARSEIMGVHEESFVRAFVAADRQERFLGFLSTSKKRRKLIDEFNHLKDSFLDKRFMNRLEGTQSLPPTVFSTLRKMGAPQNCWAMGGRFDGQEKELLSDSRLR